MGFKYYIEPLLLMPVLINTPKALSMGVSIVAIAYYVTMLKINAVDTKYKGSWKLYLYATFPFLRIKKRIKSWIKK